MNNYDIGQVILGARLFLLKDFLTHILFSSRFIDLRCADFIVCYVQFPYINRFLSASLIHIFLISFFLHSCLVLSSLIMYLVVSPTQHDTTTGRKGSDTLDDINFLSCKVSIDPLRYFSSIYYGR